MPLCRCLETYGCALTHVMGLRDSNMTICRAACYDLPCAAQAALEFLLQTGRQPDIIHTHDWPTAMAAEYFWTDYHHNGLWKPKVRHQSVVRQIFPHSEPYLVIMGMGMGMVPPVMMAVVMVMTMMATTTTMVMAVARVVVVEVEVVVVVIMIPCSGESNRHMCTIGCGTSLDPVLSIQAFRIPPLSSSAPPPPPSKVA